MCISALCLVHASPKKFEDGDFTLKTNQMFFVPQCNAKPPLNFFGFEERFPEALGLRKNESPVFKFLQRIVDGTLFIDLATKSESSDY